MNPTTALKPLAFALAAVMAFAAQAAGVNDPAQDNGQGSNQQSNGPSLDQILQITSGAGAAVLDSQ
jgi:Spy/CpxP family protein refolding chaperone